MAPIKLEIGGNENTLVDFMKLENIHQVEMDEEEDDKQESFQCEECPKSFTKPSRLVQHMRVHNACNNAVYRGSIKNPGLGR